MILKIQSYLILKKDLTNKSFFVIIILGDNMNRNLIERYIKEINNICKKYQYDNNITHLLYLIIPAFVTKYKYKEQLILNTFNNIPIIISKEKSEYINAYYTSIPTYQENKIVTKKYIVINNYEKIPLVKLLDNLVHEFNHAINSYNNEILKDNNTLYLRTGLTYATYSLPNLTPKEKLPSYILEEIINTRQTETIIDTIKNYQDTSLETISNTIYAINNETNSNYKSNAYYLETQILTKLLNNKTFIYTLENLRLEGNIKDIESWFNNITGIKDSYNILIKKLNDIINLELKLSNAKYFKNHYISKIKSLSKDIFYIIDTFNSNCNYT